MFRLIKSDLYKILRMKSFYILGALAVVLAGFQVWLLNFADKAQYKAFGLEDMFVSRYTGVYSFGIGLPLATLFIIIFVSMFVQGEFKFGTMKNIIARGCNRASVYFSKYLAMVFVSLVYMLACGIVSFAVGYFLAGAGEFNRSVFLDLLEVFGLCLLVQVALQSVFQMIGFFARSTGWAIGFNVAIYAFLPQVFMFIDLLVNNWLAGVVSSIDWLNSWMKIENFSVAKYWPDYMLQFSNIDYLHMDFFRETLTTGIIVCLSYILVSSLLGLLIFRKRDID